MILEAEGKPFEVNARREPGKYSWFEGVNMLDPNGWRLPTVEEIIEMDKYKEKLGGLGDYFYWSRTECFSDLALLWSFAVGRGFPHSKCAHFYIWQVRDVDKAEGKIEEPDGGNEMTENYIYDCEENTTVLTAKIKDGTLDEVRVGINGRAEWIAISGKDFARFIERVKELER